MSEKKVIKVLIAGKVMTMSGYESEEYMQRVAAYINSKIEEYEKTDAFRHASSDIRHRMLELNFADSYFKEKEHTGDLELRLKDKINELDEMKHNYVNSQVMVEDQKKEVSNLSAKLREAETQVTRLQTTLVEREKTIAELQLALKEAQRGGVYRMSSVEIPAVTGEKEKKEEPVALEVETAKRNTESEKAASEESVKEEIKPITLTEDDDDDSKYVQQSIEGLYGMELKEVKAAPGAGPRRIPEPYRSRKNGKRRR